MQQPSSEVNNQSKYYGNIQKFGKNVPFEVTLTKIDKITHDSYVYTYELPYPDLPLGLEPCQHIWIEAELPTKENPQGEVVKRKYTPISGADQKGTFDLLIKIYRRDVHPKFPDGGVLTQYLETLKVGDKIKIYGPVWKVTYHGHGHTTGKKEDKVYEIKSKRIGLVAGGTGIAPMFQVIKAVLDDPEDKTELSLLFANKTEGDILIKKELDAYSSDPRLKVYYTLDEATPEWKGFTGYVTPEMLQKTMPAPAEDTMVRMSGPKPMNQMVWGQLQALGHNVDLIW